MRRDGDPRSRNYRGLLVLVVMTGVIVPLQMQSAAGSTPSCVVQGPQWTQHMPALGAGHPASVLKGRLYVVMPPQYGCAKAKTTLARIFPRIPPHARAHDVLRGAPTGWVCYSSGAPPADVTYAGLCQNGQHGFLEWGPYRPPSA